MKLSEEEEAALCIKYGLQDNGKINYRQFCDVINVTFDPKNVYISPQSQKLAPLE